MIRKKTREWSLEREEEEDKLSESKNCFTGAVDEIMVIDKTNDGFVSVFKRTVDIFINIIF